jgi:hypothetical protein
VSSIVIISSDRPPERRETLPFHNALAVLGMRVVYTNLFPKPRPIAFRFSGGVNETRREFNEARLVEWRQSLRVIHDKASNTLFVPVEIREEFEASLRKVGAP